MAARKEIVTMLLDYTGQSLLDIPSYLISFWWGEGIEHYVIENMFFHSSMTQNSIFIDLTMLDEYCTYCCCMEDDGEGVIEWVIIVSCFLL
jgi:hypothetical protein